jgi:hypothetical protein
MFRKSNTIVVLAVIAAGLLLASCGSKRTVSVGKSSYYNKGVVVKPGSKGPSSIKISNDLPDATKSLLKEANKWIGTAYRYGGNSRAGVDCSGLVTNLFSSALAIKLPRNSAQQSNYCNNIPKNDLVEGDLVFFCTGGSGGVNHVGMYVGNGNMIHSSTSKGVIISSLSESYYQRTYHSSGRVEKYYAMISGKKGNAPAAPTAPSVPQIEKPDPESDILIAGTEVPEKDTGKSVAAGIASAVFKKAVEEATVRLVAATPGEATRAALERTRRKVLDEVINEKVDSIVTEFFD